MGGLTDTDDLVLEELDADWEIVCEYSQWPRDWCDGNPAEWFAYWRCQECGEHGIRMICSSCKDLVMSVEYAGMCPQCTEIVHPFRRLFVRFEPMKP